MGSGVTDRIERLVYQVSREISGPCKKWVEISLENWQTKSKTWESDRIDKKPNLNFQFCIRVKSWDIGIGTVGAEISFWQVEWKIAEDQGLREEKSLMIKY